MKYENVKVGDEFLLENNIHEFIVKVTNVTPKRFECGNYTFSKDTGNQIGGSKWSWVRFSTMTEEQRQQKLDQREKNILVKKLREVEYSKINLIDLREILIIVSSRLDEK